MDLFIDIRNTLLDVVLSPASINPCETTQKIPEFQR